MFFTSVRWLRASNIIYSSKMVRVLNVAEKNDAAKSLAQVLSQGHLRKREGFSKFNKIYEFEHRLMNQQVTMTMTSVSGHLLGLEFTGSFRKWHSCSPVDLFTVPVEKYCPDNFKDIKRTLEKEIRGCQSLVIWTDCDREGENIGYEIIDVCQAVKPNIKVYRAKFSEITPHAIGRAINNLGPPDARISNAVDVRQELDLRIGAAFTRFQTLRLQKIFPDALAEQLISYGSCQFPTLGFVVERYKQVQAFIPEPFWKIKVAHQHDDVIADFSWKRNRLFNHLACQVLYDQCIENPLATVIEVRSKTKSKWRPQALDTVELEKLASRKLKVNAKQTMQIAEKLYTQGFISYPRTETNIFPKELDLVGLVQEQTRDPHWGEFAQQVLENGPNPRNGKKTDNAHPPIHPLKYANGLQGNEGKIYEFIVRHFLACVSQDAQGHETVVDVDIAGEKFSAQGLMIYARNYLDVYPYEKWNAKEIPLYREGDQFEPNSIELVAGETSPPPLLSEADLIALMEKHGIGTDATHADHIETVKSRMYVGLRPDGKFVPGQLGMGLVEGYDSMGYEMSKPNLRAELEADLKMICEGRKTKEEVLPVHIQKYKEVFVEACRQAQKLDEALSQYLGEAQTPTGDTSFSMSAAPSVMMNCPRCGKPMALRTKKDGKGFFIGCSGYPECRACIWLPEFVLNVSLTDEVCPRCQPGPVKKLQFKFKPGSVPMSIPTNHIGCIGGCDEMLNETLGIRPLGRPSQDPTLPRSQTSTHRPTSDASHDNAGISQHRNRPAGHQQIHRPGGNTFPTNRKANSSNTSQNLWSGNNGANSNPNGSRSYHTVGQGQQATPHHNPQQRQAQLQVSPSNRVVLTSGQHNATTVGGTRGQAANNRSPLTHIGNQGWPRSNPSATPGTSRNGPWGGRSPGGSDRAGGDDEDGRAIVCACGNNAKLLTVRKEGPNTGRQFYKCASMDNSCNFFLWADEGASTSGQDYNGWGSSPTVPPASRSFQPASADPLGQAGEVTCRCGQAGKLLTVNKSGPNKGRQFYGCPKPREQSCGFFKWADEVESGGWGDGSRQSMTPFQPRATPQQVKRKHPNDGGGTRKPPTCGHCGQPGHRKNKCPEKTDYGF